MVHRFIALFLALILVISGLGCATTNPDGTPKTGMATAGGAIGGAILGAGLGAIIGAATGDVAKGTVIGAIAGAGAGAVAGFAYAKHQEKMLRDRQQAEALYNYNAQQGERVILERAEVTPPTSAQGSLISLDSDFTILNGSEQPVPVEVTKIMVFQGQQMGHPCVETSEYKSGSYSYTTPTQIPANAPEGKYMVLTRIKTPNASDEKTCEFLVVKKAASNEREIRVVSINGVPVNN